MLKKVFCVGIQKTPWEIPMRAQCYIVEFTTANKQFDWLEISLVFDKTDKHLTIYDSENAEVASALV